MPQLCIASPAAGTSPTIEAVITKSASYRPCPAGKLGPAVDGLVSGPTRVLGSACRLLLLLVCLANPYNDFWVLHLMIPGLYYRQLLWVCVAVYIIVHLTHI